MNSTSYFYAHTNQWKYEKLTLGEILSPLADPAQWAGSLIDCNTRAERMGWLPTSPQLETNPLEVCWAAERAGKDPIAYAVESLTSGAMRMSCEDQDNPKNFPRNLFVWRSNLLGASGKGHEYFLKHLLGAKNGVLGKDLGAMDQVRPEEVTWRESTPDGKLDLMVTIDFRMNTTGLFSDIVLPTATWYEKNDLNTTRSSIPSRPRSIRSGSRAATGTFSAASPRPSPGWRLVTLLTLSRGGPIIWISEADAKRAGIADNDWFEVAPRSSRPT